MQKSGAPAIWATEVASRSAKGNRQAATVVAVVAFDTKGILCALMMPRLVLGWRSGFAGAGAIRCRATGAAEFGRFAHGSSTLGTVHSDSFPPRCGLALRHRTIHKPARPR